MTHQPELLPDQPSPDQAARDAERAEYLERLRERLKDPDFRAIEGFPIGEDEDILALSDPPYYTACPNPFLPEILERWQAERAQLRAELGLPDDSDDNGNSGEPVYHREPFAADVSEGKSDGIYRAHSYHTKVPHKAVMRYILHYTDPGDVVFDGFCGTGMTGVAAQLCSDKKTVESLGYRVKDDSMILDEQGQAISRLGMRKAVLVDLSPAATFIAYNYNTPVDVVAFEREAKRILHEVEDECGWMYETWHPRCDHPQRVKGRISYTVWSDVFVCPQCGEEMVFWDVAVDKEAGNIRREWPCPGCGALLAKSPSKQSGALRVDRAWETIYDRALGQVVRRVKQVPVLINYSVGRKRHEKVPDAEDLALIQRVEESDIPYWFPTNPMMFKGEKWGDTWRAGIHAGITHIHHFYTWRNLWVLAATFTKLEEAPNELRRWLLFTFEQAIMGMSRWARYVPTHYSQVNQGLSGTLYIASKVVETSLGYIIGGKIRRLIGVLRQIQTFAPSTTTVLAQSATAIPDAMMGKVDYVFVDPPFGGNLMYSELNFFWEAWLHIFTNNKPEAVVNKVQSKGLPEYQRLMEECFQEFYRVLAPGRWMTVEFHNSQNRVWNAIQEAILRAGFMVADVRTLDKKQGTFKQITSTAAVKQDLIISAYKPRTGFERRFLEQAGSTDGAWDFVRQHLEQLPIVVEQDGTLEVVAERQAYLLYDRMVAFHIQRGFSVSLGAAEFYAGLKQRFPERDGMYFLSHQVTEYDRRRMQVSQVEQLALFVTDEKSVIQWLRRELDPSTGSGPQTYQDLQPKFLRELHQARHEALPELSDVLTQNFLKDELDRWYVPDPARQEDLEKLRERSLLREFQEYAQGKGRLKVFRTEAVRAGFKHAWRERDYRLIVKVAERLPASVLQEDAGLLMYYDNALMRAESEPEQGRLL
ncbi:MAG: DNA methylase [Anaerolineae bacterium]|nr:DNA methylase [Anaerolineae bacterium]